MLEVIEAKEDHFIVGQVEQEEDRGDNEHEYELKSGEEISLLI